MPKRLVVCADGTWNEPQQTDRGLPAPTNVVKLASAVAPEDRFRVPQVVAYHKGVGERGGLLDKLTGGAFGVGISENILELYTFLVTNFAPGDELWFFGFSRGAYTVRSLAGLVRNCGILRREHMGRCAEAYALYRDRAREAHPKGRQAVSFRDAYAWEGSVEVRFIGVWDTVGALGIPVYPLRFWTKRQYEFHDVELSSHVGTACQALALDERRRPFQPSLWRCQPDSPGTQVLEQAWFPGVHGDVGGGYAEAGLSDGALAWMCDRASRAGLALEPARLPSPDPLSPEHDSMTWFYRVMGGGTRTPGTGGAPAREALHVSALQRRDALGALSEVAESYLGTHPAVAKP